MKVIVNGKFFAQRKTGVQRFATEILLELDKIAVLGEWEVAIPPEVKDAPQYNNIKVVRIGHCHSHLWEQISFPLYVWREKGVALNLCNVAPLMAPGIVFIHDMKIKAVPQFFTKKRFNMDVSANILNIL